MLILPYLYALAFGLTGVFYARKFKKNPYVWFAVGCLWKSYGLLLMFASLLVSGISIHLLKKRYSKRFRPDFEEVQTVDTVPVFVLQVSPEARGKFWYALKEDGTRTEPMSFQALENALKKGEVGEETYVWNETFENWKRIKDLP